jgi:glucosamine-6-phosphate deaminase
MGQAAGEAVLAELERLLAVRPRVSMLFASAASQNELLERLALGPAQWSRVTAFHLDEYIGLPVEAPQRFGHYLRQHLFDRAPLAEAHFIDGNAADPRQECRRYADLLRRNPVDIVCMGIGENGHIAFNEPEAANFDDPEWVKIVNLDEASRAQQVHDGAFGEIGQVPRQALTLTVPAIMAGKFVACVVPGQRKAQAVAATLQGPIGPACPATVLRTHAQATLYLDALAAEQL